MAGTLDQFDQMLARPLADNRAPALATCLPAGDPNQAQSRACG